MSSAPDAPPSESSSAKPAKPSGAVPVALTVLATVLAGLSSSEMTQSMFHRSQATQHQSKATDQWSFFQAKKMRGATLDAADDLAQMLALRPLSAASYQRLAESVKTAAGKIDGPAQLQSGLQALRRTLDLDTTRAAIPFLLGPDLPAVDEKKTQDADLEALLKAIRGRMPEPKTVDLVSRVSPAQIDSAIEIAEAKADAFDQACAPTTNAIRGLERSVADARRAVEQVEKPSEEVKQLATTLKDASASLTLSRQNFTSRRYAREAVFNQQIGELFEAEVRRAGFESERHRTRSKNFFYAMLAAQGGVTIASLALARAHRSRLWLLAGIAGVTALGFGAFVYLAM